MAIDEEFTKRCENSSFYVPKTDDDLKKVNFTANIDHLDQPVRILTDYIRSNKTHLWSNSSKNWWNIFNEQDMENSTSIHGKFKDSVTFNGYGKVKNSSPLKHGCCVCIVDLKLIWQFKSLILALIASSIFVVTGISMAKLL